jgi:1-acyl-sn-glycerol-3-phosphate acyltransferase
MKKRICSFLLRLMGWKTEGGVVPEKKCIIIGVPHTSAWDFIISYLFYTAKGGKAHILIKKEFFFWPVGYFIKKMGGLSIDRSKGANVIRQTVQLFNEMEVLHLAMTPEGTRKRVTRWKGGFHTIAKNANIPVYLVCFDWGRKQASVWEKFELSDDVNEDIKRMKDYYREKGVRGKYPDQFTTDY